MTDTEKLIELMQEAYCCVTCGYGDQDKVKWLLECDISINWEDIAEHLLANNVIVLPCPVGTMVYQIRDTKVDDFYGGASYHHELGVRRAIFDVDLIYQFGKTVFLTEEEAKEKLKEMEAAKSER